MDCPNCHDHLVLADTEDPYDSQRATGEFTGRVVCAGACCDAVWQVRLKLRAIENFEELEVMSVEDYLQGGKKCPTCNSTQITDSGFPTHAFGERSATAVLSLQCACHGDTWWEIYEMVSLEPVLG